MITGAKAGRISKPYGLRGELQILLEPEAGNHIEPNNPLFIEIDGQRIPFFMEEVELLSPEQAIIKLEFIDSLEEARRFQGCSLFFDSVNPPERHRKEASLQDVVGYVAIDQTMGELGQIMDYIPQGMNPVLVIAYQGKEIMVPAVLDFVDRIDHKRNKVHFILPDGLLQV